MSTPNYCRCWCPDDGESELCGTCGRIRVLPSGEDKAMAEEFAGIFAGVGEGSAKTFDEMIDMVARRIGEVRAVAVGRIRHRLNLQPRFCDLVIGLPAGMSVDDNNTGFNASLRTLATMIKTQEEKQ